MSYSDKEKKNIKNHIINEMIGSRSLASIIDNDKDMPCYKTVFNWLNPESDYHDREFLHNYTRANEIRAEKEFEQILTIADSTGADIITDDMGNKVTNHAVIQRDRLRVDSRKWRLGKMQPKKYGEKLDITSDNKPINDSKVILNIDGKNIKLE